MSLVLSGTPFIGYLSLASTAAAQFALFNVMGQAAFTLPTTERVYITNITVSSSDTSTDLLTIDTGPVTAGSNPTPTKIVSAYISASKPLQPIQVPPGCLRGVFGIVPRAALGTYTSGTVEIILKGYTSRT